MCIVRRLCATYVGWAVVIWLAAASVIPVSAALPPVSLAPGTTYETPLYIIKAAKPGPVVLVTGGVHGNEPAGYQAADRVRKLSVTKGTLLVIPRVNAPAVRAGQRSVAGENLNRLFPRTAGDKSGHAAVQAVMSILDDYDVDWVLDLHEGVNYSRISSSVGQSVIYYPQGRAASMAKKITAAHNQSIQSQDKQFSLLRYPVKGSLARAAAVVNGAQSMILETCAKESLNVRVNYHVQAVQLVLRELGML
jgi:predicted deacylase